MTATMKAWFALHDGAVEARSVPRLPPSDSEVEIRVDALGVCGSDRHLLASGNLPHGGMPLGHEIAGTVVRTGSDVPSHLEGSRVCIDPFLPCESCGECSTGRWLRCEAGAELGFDRPGGWQEYLRVPARNIHLIPDAMTFADATQIELVHCCLGAMEKSGAFIGDSVAVVGDGPAATIFVQLMRLVGAVVTQFGMDDSSVTFGSRVGPHRARSSQVYGEFLNTFDAVIDAAGGATSMQQSLAMVRRQGIVVAFGLPSTPSSLSVEEIILKNVTIVGTTNAPHVWGKAIQLVGDGSIDVSHICGQRFTLGDLPSAMHVSATQVGLKAILTREAA